MLNRIVTPIILAAFVLTTDLPQVSLLGPDAAYAGEGGNTDAPKIGKRDKKATTAKTSKKKDKQATAKPKRPHVPITDQSSNRTVSGIQDKLHRAAKKDNLEGMISSLKEIRTFQRSIDRVYDQLDDTPDQNEPQKIYNQLTEYQKQRQNKALRTNARTLAGAVATVRLMDQALALKAKCKKLKAAGDTIGALNCEQAYKDARSDYHRKADQIKPRAKRDKLFKKLPKSPYDA